MKRIALATMLFALGALAAHAPSAAAADGKHRLTYGFAPGESYLVDSVFTTVTTTSGNRAQFEMRIRDRIRVLSVEAGRIVLEHECLANDLKQDGDSDLSPKDFRMLARGQKARVEVSADGRALKAPASPVDGFKEYLLPDLPENPVAVGGTWREAPIEVEVPNVGKLELRGDWTFARVKEEGATRHAYLEFKGAMRDAGRGANAKNEVRYVHDLATGTPVKMRTVNGISCDVAGRVKVDVEVTVESSWRREAAPAAKPAGGEW